MTDSRGSLPLPQSADAAASDDEKARSLAVVTAEVRDDPRVRALTDRTKTEWRTLDESLFAKLDREDAEATAATRFRGSRAAWGVLAAITAAAAAILVLAGRTDSDPLGRDNLGDSAQESAHTPTLPLRERASKLARDEGAGSVLVNKQSASRERELAAGDSIEARGGRAVFVEPSKITWALENASRVSVRHAASPLVLTLEHGAVEAQVAPVSRGEAFAVDVDGARIAVHGTHLRVERIGEKVVVDLTDGVISVGPAPLRGSTYGSLVTAPAHVEFQIEDPRGTMRVEHTASFVRSATSLPLEDEAKKVVANAHALDAAAPPNSIAITPPPVASTPLRALRAPSAVPPAAAPLPTIAAREAVHVETTAAPTSPSPMPYESVSQSSPEQVASAHPFELGVADSVKACWEKHAPPHGNVAITVRTTLTLVSNEDGVVRVAQFDPPLPPAVQSCASEGIYRSHFAKASRIAIPLELVR
jgi:ferric-dicitrate binding protein FerR (iron transport regulator)